MFWLISQAWNGRSNSDEPAITTEDAIHELAQISGPQNIPLVRRASKLLEEIIEGRN